MECDNSGLSVVATVPSHLDTVRALHQTVVSLRTALELSKNELKELKNKYEKHSIKNNYADVIQKLTLENHILRRKIIKTEGLEIDSNTKAVGTDTEFTEKLEPNPYEVEQDNNEFSVVRFNINEDSISVQTTSTAESSEQEFDDVVDVATKIVPEQAEAEDPIKEYFCGSQKLHEATQNSSRENNLNSDLENFEDVEAVNSEKDPSTVIFHTEEKAETDKTISESVETAYRSYEQKNFKTKIQLQSKFDVKIKVKTFRSEVPESSSTSDTDSTAEKDNKTYSCPNTAYVEQSATHQQDIAEDSENFKVKTHSTENIEMAVSGNGFANKNDKFNVQVRITSEESLLVEECKDKDKTAVSKLDLDNLSIRSSEGDNSVFAEDHVDGADGNQEQIVNEKCAEDNGSGNESEEVDDIELIFTTDDSKDMSNLQEGLVSIRESETWCPSPHNTGSSTTHSTPVLIKFNTLDPDFQPGEHQKVYEPVKPTEESLRTKRVSLPDEKEIKHVAFNGKSLDVPERGILKGCENKSDNALYRTSNETRRLDSEDSFSTEYRGQSFDTNKSSSFEMGSSMDILTREESVDSVNYSTHMGHRYSVFAATDISKCGISEEDLSAANLRLRRNTCPNPFLYKPLPARSFPRSSGPFKAMPTATRCRPILRADSAYSARRENGAQTDVSALPNRWSSDGYLAHKVGGSVHVTPPTLPSRGGTGAPARRPPQVHTLVPPPRRSDESRRVLLSDIGFTSMVPELSRSADPLWAGRGSCASCGQPPLPSAGGAAPHKYLSSRGSFKSAGRSVEQSYDWTSSYVPAMATSSQRDGGHVWRSSLPDVRGTLSGHETDELLDEADNLRRSIDNLHQKPIRDEGEPGRVSRPYIPTEPRNLRLGHVVKLITPHGRVAVGRVRYVGVAGSSPNSGVLVGAILPLATNPTLPLNDGTYQGRRYFQVPPAHTALFVPFSKVVMAWAN